MTQLEEKIKKQVGATAFLVASQLIDFNQLDPIYTAGIKIDLGAEKHFKKIWKDKAKEYLEQLAIIQSEKALLKMSYDKVLDKLDQNLHETQFWKDLAEAFENKPTIRRKLKPDEEQFNIVLKALEYEKNLH